MTRLMMLLIVSLIGCACDEDIRPYKHWIYVRSDDCARQLEDPDPKNDVCGEALDHWIMQPVIHFKMKEAERTRLKVQLDVCQKRQ